MTLRSAKPDMIRRSNRKQRQTDVSGFLAFISVPQLITQSDSVTLHLSHMCCQSSSHTIVASSQKSIQSQPIHAMRRNVGKNHSSPLGNCKYIGSIQISDLANISLMSNFLIVTSLIVSITKCLMVISSPFTYLLRNWSKIIRVSNYSCLISTFCNWIVVVGHPCCAFVHQVYWNEFFQLLFTK